MRMATPKIFDVLIIGGGPAGLSMATTLARQAQTTLILDSATYRNAPSKHMHGIPGFDHVDPAAFRAKVRKDLADRYSACVEYKTATVAEVRRLTEEDGGVTGFEAVDTEGVRYRGLKLGLGTGVRDVVEGEGEGYEECWGKGIFHCLFCHGFEERGAESVGVLATGLVSSPEIIMHVARMAKNLAHHVTIYTNALPSLSTSTLTSHIKSSKISIDTRPIARLSLVDSQGPQVRISFADGSADKVEGFLTSHPSIEQRAGDLVAQLGLETTPQGDVKVTPPWNETSVPGVFAMGDAATPMKNVMNALYLGSFAAAGMVAQIQKEREEKDEL